MKGPIHLKRRSRRCGEQTLPQGLFMEVSGDSEEDWFDRNPATVAPWTLMVGGLVTQADAHEGGGFVSFVEIWELCRVVGQ